MGIKVIHNALNERLDKAPPPLSLSLSLSLLPFAFTQPHSYTNTLALQPSTKSVDPLFFSQLSNTLHAPNTLHPSTHSGVISEYVNPYLPTYTPEEY